MNLFAFYAFAILVQVPVRIIISDCSVAGDSVGIKDRRWDALLLLLLLLLVVVGHSCQNSSRCFFFRAAQRRAKLTFDSLL